MKEKTTSRSPTLIIEIANVNNATLLLSDQVQCVRSRRPSPPTARSFRGCSLMKLSARII